MIVDPDFLDHWRTRMLVDALGGDEMAPMYLMRLWGHCQVRRSDRFDMPPAGLKAQCRYPGDADAFEKALTEGKFVARHGSEIEVLGWAEQNASLLAAWENGHKGGRPKKPKANPQVNDSGSDGQNKNPGETQGKPSDNPTLTQTKPIRVDKSREDSNTPQPPVPGGDLFDEFWAAYPRKIGKDAARKAFERRKVGKAVLADMLRAIQAQKATPQWLRDAGQFIPHPTTWLNEGRWQDEAVGALWGSTEVAL